MGDHHTMIRTVTIAIAAFLGLAVIGAIAQTITSSGGGTATSIASTCGSTTGQLLFNSSGSCAGTTDLIYSQGSGNATLTNNQGGNITLQTGQTNQLVLSNNGTLTATTTSATGFNINFGPLIAPVASLTGLSTGTNADFLCLQANGTVLIQTSACTISSLRFKPDWKPYNGDAMAKLAGLDVGTFHLNTGPNSDPNAKSLQAGLSAESVAAIAPECAIYEDDMKTPKSYRQECVIALLVKAIQQLHK